LFPQLLALDRFNARRRELIAVIEAVRRDWRDQKLDRRDPVRLTDSAPVALMTYSRGARCISVVGHEYFGVVTSKKAKVFGWRLHVTTTVDQLIDEWILAPASYVDGDVLEVLMQTAHDLVLIGDKGYTDAALEERLWRTRRIVLLPLRRKNEKRQWDKDIRKILGRIRHNVETVFSTVSTVFNLERPRGRSVAGHVVRIATILLAHTLSFFMV
jgi:UDP-2,3-diacylglucosamine pyrophosphatase LpxH